MSIPTALFSSVSHLWQRPESRPSDRSPATAEELPPIIAFCHLPWDGVWQRPQQFLSRLSARHRVLFVETYCSPVPQSEIRTRRVTDYPSVTVLQMHLPASRWAEGDFIDGERRRLLADFRRHTASYVDPILWFNDPMAVTAFAGHAGEQLIVYDCMDELTQFQGAPPALAVRERELLLQADVVFCGGRKMRDKRRPLNANVHFYGTGVDCEHFGRALDARLEVPPDIARLSGPVLGYFGVIDERIDYELLTRLADALPACQIAMVGPTAKIDPASLPRRRNLHWLGRREYAELPAITKGFSVCLMPFAQNAATEYINPTKALEYLATGRPVVSTAIPEVVSNFSKVCAVAANAADFVTACQRALRAPSATRRAAGLRLAHANTWEAIVTQLERHLLAATPRREGSETAAATVPDGWPVGMRRAAHV